MRSTNRLDIRTTLAPRLAIALLAALVAACVTPIPVAAQGTGGRPLFVDQYVSRANLDPSVVGDRTRLEGVGFRVTQPLAVPGTRHATRLPERVAFGGFVTYAMSTDPGLTALQYGVLADVPLRAAPLATPFAARVQPLASLGLGAFRARRTPSASVDRSANCVAPADVLVPHAPLPCDAGVPDRPMRTDLAVSPALGLRLGLGRAVALRTDVRDVVVYRGGARHNVELATGLSFVR